MCKGVKKYRTKYERKFYTLYDIEHAEYLNKADLDEIQMQLPLLKNLETKQANINLYKDRVKRKLEALKLKPEATQNLPSIEIYFFILEVNNKLYEYQFIDNDKYSDILKTLIPELQEFYDKNKDKTTATYKALSGEYITVNNSAEYELLKQLKETY